MLQISVLPVGPTLDASGGQFENGQATHSLLRTNVVESFDEAHINKQIEDLLLTAPKPTKDGYEFISWETQQTTRATDLDKMNTVYYAKWEAIPVTLPDDVPVKYTDTPVTLPDDVPVDTSDASVTLPDDEKQGENNGSISTVRPDNGNVSNGSISNVASNNNPQTGDTVFCRLWIRVNINIRDIYK